MLTPLEICDQLTVDEFILLCQALGPIHKFEVEDIQLNSGIKTVVVSVASFSNTIEVDLWPISA